VHGEGREVGGRGRAFKDFKDGGGIED